MLNTSNKNRVSILQDRIDRLQKGIDGAQELHINTDRAYSLLHNVQFLLADIQKRKEELAPEVISLLVF